MFAVICANPRTGKKRWTAKFTRTRRSANRIARTIRQGLDGPRCKYVVRKVRKEK